MRTVWMFALSVLAACDAAHKAPARQPSDAGPAADGGEAEFEVLVTQSVSAYDDALRAECECVVRAGGFENVEDCIAPSASGPTWIACGTAALAANASPEVRAIAQCFTDALENRSRCLASVDCDSPDRQQCASTALSCAGSEPQLIAKLIEACPDLGLLSRLGSP